MIYRFADFDFKLEKANEYGLGMLEPYAITSSGCAAELKLTSDLIEAERRIAFEEQGEYFSDDALSLTAVHRQIADWLPAHEAFLMHAAVIRVNGIGVAFSARSGTGKTTHMRLWKRLLGDELTVVNGDKPIIRFFDDRPLPVAYGTPWNGKEGYGDNSSVPLRHICRIERAEENSVEPLNSDEAIKLLFDQIHIPRNGAAVSAVMSMINRMLSACSFWRIRCNMEPEAARTAYEALFDPKQS